MNTTENSAYAVLTEVSDVYVQNKDIKMTQETVVLGVDIGYSFVKVCVGNQTGEIIKKFKFPSIIGVTKHLEGVENSSIVHYDGNYYMVGEDAKHLPSVNIQNLEEYKNLEYFAPLLLNHAIKLAKLQKVDVVVSGLSIAQLDNSGHFQNALEHFVVDGTEHNYKVLLLPQGAGAKLTYDKYGNEFPNVQKEFLGETNYVIVDIGFSTLDFVYISKGLTDPNLFQGIEKHGLMKIASLVAKLIHEKHNRQLSLPEAREILDTGIYKLRGQRYDYSKEIQEIKNEYLKEIIKLVEDRYGEVLDKIDFLVLLGGGSYIFNTTQNGFIRVVKNESEFYNAIGEYLYGVKNIA